MRRLLMCVAAVALGAAVVESGLVRAGGDEESPSAKATRKKLLQKITLEAKEVRFKDMTEDIKNAMDKPISFKIDNASGISNNTKLTYSCKDKQVDQVLNELSDKFEFGWYVLSNPKDRNDGWVILRKYKAKERGWEDGKEPKKTSLLDLRRDHEAMQIVRDECFTVEAVGRAEE